MCYSLHNSIIVLFILLTACVQVNHNRIQPNTTPAEQSEEAISATSHPTPYAHESSNREISDEELFLELREQHWDKIFPNGGRNSGGPQFLKYIYENLASSHDLFRRYNQFYCGVSGSIVYPGGEERYDTVKVKSSSGECIIGEYRRCCWPCSCDVMKYARAEQVEIQLPNDPTQEIAAYWVLTIGDPCHKCDDLPCDNLPKEVTAYQCKNGLTQNGLRTSQGKITTQRGEGRLIFAVLHNAHHQREVKPSVSTELLQACQPRINANPEELQSMSGMGNIFVDLALINSNEEFSNSNEDLCH